ncbi:MAG: hypothetical protein RLZZ546_1677, partial [Bacteroidota bacterium]
IIYVLIKIHKIMIRSFLLLMSAVLIFSCTKNSNERDCTKDQVNVNLTKAEVQKNIYNTWILKEMITM